MAIVIDKINDRDLYTQIMNNKNKFIKRETYEMAGNPTGRLSASCDDKIALRTRYYPYPSFKFYHEKIASLQINSFDIIDYPKTIDSAKQECIDCRLDLNHHYLKHIKLCYDINEFSFCTECFNIRYSNTKNKIFTN